MIDLKQFCGNDEFRSYLNEPFTQGNYTYATNGHIMVRVQKVDSVGPCKSKVKFDASKPLVGIERLKFETFSFSLPPDPGKKGTCVDCDGRGYKHDCPDCECTCNFCKGSGEADPEGRISTTIAGRAFCLRYVRMITSLPTPQIAKTDGETPLYFRFEGGVGALMMRRKPFENHVEIEK
jgi:hypothetical protein